MINLTMEEPQHDPKTYCIYQDWNFLHDGWNQEVEGFHPITSEQEAPVDVEVAAVIAVDFST